MLGELSLFKHCSFSKLLTVGITPMFFGVYDSVTKVVLKQLNIGDYSLEKPNQWK